MLNLDAGYRLAARAAIRPEPFGGLIYRYDNRRLYFLHSPELVEFVRGLDGAQSLSVALDEFVQAHALAAGTRTVFVRALGQLERMGILEGVASESASSGS